MPRLVRLPRRAYIGAVDATGLVGQHFTIRKVIDEIRRRRAAADTPAHTRTTTAAKARAICRRQLRFTSFLSLPFISFIPNAKLLPGPSGIEPSIYRSQRESRFGKPLGRSPGATDSHHWTTFHPSRRQLNAAHLIAQQEVSAAHLLTLEQRAPRKDVAAPSPDKDTRPLNNPLLGEIVSVNARGP